MPGWDSAPQAHSRVLNINFDIWIFGGGLYKYPMKNCQPTPKFLATWGLNQRYCPGLKDTTDTPRFELYIDIHLDINSAGRLKTKLYYKRDDFNCELSIFIHANPRETKSGRGGGVFFSEGCKMVHSAAFWI